jgi:hypothetical protein
MPTVMAELGLGVGQPLGEPGPLELRDRGQDRQHELGDPVARAVATQVEQPQVNATGPEGVDRLQGVERRSSLGEITMSPGRRRWINRWPCGRSRNGIEPLTPPSMKSSASVQPYSRQRPSIRRFCSSRLMPWSRCSAELPLQYP